MTTWGNGVFIHPGMVKQGYLTKSPPERNIVSMWRRRWCILTETGGELFLAYYHDESSSYQTTPIARVSLGHCHKVESNVQHKDRENVFAIHLPERVYYFSAPSRYEMAEWVDKICEYLNLQSSSDSFMAYPDSHLSISTTSNVYGTSPNIKQSATYPRTASPLPTNPSPQPPHSGTLPRTPSPRLRNWSNPPPPPQELIGLAPFENRLHVDSPCRSTRSQTLDSVQLSPTGRKKDQPLPPIPPLYQDNPPPPLPPRPEALRHSTASNMYSQLGGLH